MNDRELLEMAAKAVGNGAQWDCGARGMMVLTPAGNDAMTWNPLNDDGDALRLAVKLKLCVDVSDEEGDRKDVSVGTGDLSVVEYEWLGDDPCADVRRAIVRAAAEIGRATP